MSFGLSSSGFDKKRYEDIEAELQDAFRAIDPEINLAPDGLSAHIIAAFALSLAEAWDVLQALYSSQLSDAAEGVNLDGVAAFTGVNRLGASKSVVTAIAAGDAGTVLPIGRVASVQDSGERFESTAAVTIPAAFAGLAYLRAIVATPTAAQTYVFAISSPVIASVNILTGGAPTPQTVGAAFVAAVNANPTMLTALIPFTNALTGAFGFTVTDLDIPVTVTLTTAPDANTIQARGVAIPMQAQNDGPVAAAENQLNVIETPVSGWNEIFNPDDAVFGRDIETDAELRLQREQSLQASGFSVTEAIRSHIRQDVTGVTAVIVIENELDVTDSATPVGRPPHSLEAVVQGGDDTEIAQRLYEVKAATIPAVSSQNVGQYKVTKNILDSMGINHVISFSRPVQLTIYARVTVMLHPEEGALVPVDYVDRIKSAVVAFGDALQIGVDILPGRIETAVFESVGGLYAVTVEISTSAIVPAPDPIQKARTLPLEIGNTSIADFALANVAVVTVGTVGDTDYP